MSTEPATGWDYGESPEDLAAWLDAYLKAPGDVPIMVGTGTATNGTRALLLVHGEERVAVPFPVLPGFFRALTTLGDRNPEHARAIGELAEWCRMALREDEQREDAKPRERSKLH